MTALEPCPNPECPGSEPVIDQHPQILTSKAVRVICLGCQTCGPLRNTESEARRLWNALPRAPRWTSEPPKVPGFYWVRITNPEGRVTAVYVSWFGDCRMGGTPDPGTEYAPASAPLEATP